MERGVYQAPTSGSCRTDLNVRKMAVAVCMEPMEQIYFNGNVPTAKEETLESSFSTLGQGR